MTSQPTPKQPPQEGDVLFLRILHSAEGLRFAADWKQQLSDEQKFEVATAVERIMRHESVSYKEAHAVIDAAAKLGFTVQDHPILLKLVESRMKKEE